jgi:PAS domain-containing protein
MAKRRYRDDTAQQADSRLTHVNGYRCCSCIFSDPKFITQSPDPRRKHILLERSMQALTANELRFRDVVETTTDWVWEADSQFRFIWISDRFPSVTGFSIDDWIGRQVHELALNENHVTSLLDKFAESDEEFVLQLQKCRYVSARTSSATAT